MQGVGRGDSAMAKSTMFLAVSLVSVVVVASAQEGTKPSNAPDVPYLNWRLMSSEQGYSSIDGKHLKEYVEEQTAISRRYRDHGHPQFWGRITGTEGDAENAQWMLDKFRKIGLSDAHQQMFDLPPQWQPQSWSVAASAGGKTVTLESAQPASTTPGTPAAGLELEAVDVALASEGDLAGRDLKASAVWGSLPGTSDESIYVIAHRDGWFEGAVDNGSGVATMLGLAEYFAKIPKEQRRRTIYFIGTSGHHDNFAMTGHWLADHKELFAKTALIINCEHTSAEQLIYRGGTIRRSNTTVPLRWYVGGSPQLQKIAVNAYE